ncbi:hypothetical protein HG530_004315 [Fusarium avenaceum]|nr:hypothetical protein HG530_004315 [Fusarium avenaceum]
MSVSMSSRPWNVAVGETEPLEKETTGEANAEFVRAPGIKAVAYKLLDVAETLAGRLVKILSLLDLLKQPRLDKGTSANHNGVDTRLLDILVVFGVRVTVAVAEEVHTAILSVREAASIGFRNSVSQGIFLLAVSLDECGTLADVTPIGFLGVSLLTAASMKSEGSASRSTKPFSVLSCTEGQLSNELGCCRAVVSNTSADLGGDGDFP